ncbi:MAG: type I methionyl aminopeptidase [Erysipelotrichales bacterium]|nr:type I methionyl aminopeptidase [Erysipelotrichales bacterium]
MEREEIRKRIAELKAEGKIVPPMSLIKTPEQIEAIKKSAEINTALLDFITPYMKEGVTTGEIDRLVYKFTTEHGAIPAPLNYGGYPKSVCVSINEVVCHGIPGERIMRSGDIVNVDVSTIYNGYFSDASRMFCIGEVPPAKKKLVEVCQEALELGLQEVKPWGHVGDIGAAIEAYATKHRYSVVRDFCGHGVGLQFHEDPNILHYGKRNTGMVMVPGMIFTIEPMINMGKSGVVISKKDGWTATTVDKKPSAQWELMVLVTDDGYEVLSR